MSRQHQVADGGYIMVAKRERLFHGGAQRLPAVASAQLKQLDHLPCAMLAAMPNVQRLPQPVEGLWPAPGLAPLGQSRRTGQGAGLAFEHIEIVLQIQDLLLATVAAFMAGDALAFMP